MSFFKKIEIPLTLSSLIIILFLADYYLMLPSSLSWAINRLVPYSVILTAFTLIVGAVNIFMVHYKPAKAGKTATDYYYHIYLLVLIIAYTALGLVLGQRHDLYVWILAKVYAPIAEGTYGIMAVYYSAAIYRSFRIRSIETAIVSFFIVIMALFHSPLVAVVYPWIYDFGWWMLNNVLVPSSRGNSVCAAIGAILLSLRMILMIERRYIGTDV